MDPKYKPREMAFKRSQSEVVVQAYHHLGIRHVEEFLESEASPGYIACTIQTDRQSQIPSCIYLISRSPTEF